MKAFITGGMGFVGTNLTRTLLPRGYDVTVLDRSGSSARALPEGVTRVVGDSTVPGAWQQALADHEVVINLAGASIFQRWNAEVKKAIRESRILTTRHVVEAIGWRKGRETHFFSTSAVGYYGLRGDEILAEDGQPGTDFMARLGQEWESEALTAKESGARVVITRFGLVLGRNGGVLGQLVPLFRRHLGSRLGSGRQWFSWIHEEDLAQIFLYLLEKEDMDGAVNCTAPNPVRNRELTSILGEVLGTRALLPFAPALGLRVLLGEFANVILEGQRVVPRRLLESGYSFRFPTLLEALEDLVRPSAEWAGAQR